MPKASVIIPTHNRSQLLTYAMKSVLAQTCRDFELIVVDDGSSDNTAQVVKSFQDSRVIYIPREDGERAAARNAGIQVATSDCVAFLDDDDMWKPELLESALKLFERAGVGLVHTGWSYVDETGSLLPQAPSVPAMSGDVFKNELLDSWFPTSAAIVRRKCLESVGGFDREMIPAEDWDLWSRIAGAGYLFDCVPEPLVLYRLHSSNSSKAIDVMEESMRRHLDRVFANLPVPSYESYRGEAFARLDFRIATKRFGTAQVDTGCTLFARAVRTFPPMLLDLGTYYQIIAAMQPDGYKGTQHYLDLDLGQVFIERALDAVFGHSHPDELASYRAVAYANAYLSLALMNYGSGRMVQARALLSRAIAHDRRLLTRKQVWWAWAKTWVPPQGLSILRSWRRSLGAG